MPPDLVELRQMNNLSVVIVRTNVIAIMIELFKKNHRLLPLRIGLITFYTAPSQTVLLKGPPF